MQEHFAIIGLGYVGLPVAMGFARHFKHVTGFDIDKRRIAELQRGYDRTGEIAAGEFDKSNIRFSDDPASIAGASFFIITVPTPIDGDRRPDLRPLEGACRTVGKALSKGAVVVFESTVWPGLTEEVCAPWLEQHSGLKAGVDFHLGYSPERINPGDREHRLENITKVVAGDTPETLARIAGAYRSVVTAGIHECPNIRAAEASKVIENTQRDLNIALMNELALIFERLDIRTADVLAAARTKWNFLPFTPGLVGGHCIGVDPYYLTARAEAAGYHPEVILAGRRINDGMGSHIARKLVKLLIQSDRGVRGARVGVLGLTFKENVPDLRNSRVPDILSELHDFGAETLVHDPLADAAEARAEYGVELVPEAEMTGLDALVMAVPHRQFLNGQLSSWLDRMGNGGIIIDVKSAIPREAVGEHLSYWSL